MSRSIESGISRGEIISYGATGGIVTGSCNRANIKDSSIVVDYGMFQKDGEKNNFVPAQEILKGSTDLLFTHVHLDHIGLAPKIVGEGLDIRILVTENTAAFMDTVLYNSADIQREKPHKNRLYSPSNVQKMFQHMEVAPIFEPIPIGEKRDNITAEFLPNGHVVGSSSIFIRNEDKKYNEHNILFTGDIGKPNQSICGGYLDYADRYPIDPVNILVTESTNFNREPVSFKEKETNFLNAINYVWENGGNPLLPVLSFHRLPEILEILHHNQGGRIPNDCQIFIDAPLGVSLLDKLEDFRPDQLSERYGDNPNFYKTEKESLDRFVTANTTIINSHDESVNNSNLLTNYRGKAIIIASGGMGEHGRSINYLKGSFCRNPKNTVIFTCYQVEGTPGYKLVNQKRILNGSVAGAQVFQIDGFTSHISGPQETFDFLYRFNLDELHTVIINHGQDSARLAMAEEFKRRGVGKNIILPSLNQRISLY